MQKFAYGNVRYGLCGFGLLIVSYALFFFDPVEIIKTAKLKFVEGSFAYQLWQKPPVKVYVNVFIFNVTNADRFLAGEDDKLNVEEIGPYVYWEELENTNCTFYNNDTVTYVPRRKIHFELKSSVGNPETDRIIVPNLPLLGFSSMLMSSSMLINLGFNSLVEYLDSQPLLELSVKEFLWGYEDQLVNMASKILPTWINFSKFGLLDRMFDEGTNVVQMTVPSEHEQKQRPYSIDQFNGSPILQQWVKDDDWPEMNKCSLNASSDGLLFPRHLTTDMSFPIYRKAFCRTLPATYASTGETSDGYPVYFYTFQPDVFNSSLDDNSCYCPQDGCLPPGLSDISPCYYNIPVAVSFPHFYGGDPSLMDNVNGLTPDKEKHQSTIAVQPDLGIPLAVDINIQLNLVMKHTRYVNRVKIFNGLTLPICWMKLEVKELPRSLNSLLYLCFNLGPVLVKAVVLLTASAGFFLVGLTIRRFGKEQRKQQKQVTNGGGSESRRDCYEDDDDDDDHHDHGDNDGSAEFGLIVKCKSGQTDGSGGKRYLPLHIVPTSSVAIVEYEYPQDYARGR